jgi:Mn-dependent DtxR family transcriptional regulator
LDLLRQLINEGTTECSQLAQAMGVSKYTVSRLAKRAKKAGWLDTVKREYVIVNTEE